MNDVSFSFDPSKNWCWLFWGDLLCCKAFHQSNGNWRCKKRKKSSLSKKKSIFCINSVFFSEVASVGSNFGCLKLFSLQMYYSLFHKSTNLYNTGPVMFLLRFSTALYICVLLASRGWNPLKLLWSIFFAVISVFQQKYTHALLIICIDKTLKRSESAHIWNNYGSHYAKKRGFEHDINSRSVQKDCMLASKQNRW